jgi:hypothetical protein
MARETVVTDRNSETDPVDPADDLFTRDFIKD